MIVLDNSITYFVGAFFIVLGLIPFFPNIASKILKKEIKSKKKEKVSGIFLLVIGIGLLVVGYMGWLF